MSIEIVPFAGWERGLMLRNDQIEVQVTLDVGPRVLMLRRPGGVNVFKNYPDQMGNADESEWMIRGGHRLWLSPEDEIATYHPDNCPVQHVLNPDGSVTFINPVEPILGIRKELTLKLSESGASIEVRHRAIKEFGPTVSAATWALSVMAPGGTQIIPQPPLGSHPIDLLPNRLMVIWAYTDLTDSRWKLGKKYFMLRQDAAGGPTKIGLAHDQKWIAYLLGNEIFIKTFEFDSSARYADGGCNFETFSNEEMLEIESLGPLRDLAPGDSTEHTEHWYLFETDGAAPLDNEELLEGWLAPYLAQINI